MQKVTWKWDNIQLKSYHVKTFRKVEPILSTGRNGEEICIQLTNQNKKMEKISKS